jgi:SAM-dependent methyltransferase
VRVEGLDASQKMVDRLRPKPAGADLPVTIGDMAEMPVEGPFSLVYVVFNTFFDLPDQAAQVRCFRRVADVLAPGGRSCSSASSPIPRSSTAARPCARCG